jgi:plasmid stabilization system protein ParE
MLLPILTECLITLPGIPRKGARRVHERIRSIIDLILRHPEIGQTTSRPGMRRIIASPYPYLIFYRATTDEIVIHGVRHSARRPSSWPE